MTKQYLRSNEPIVWSLFGGGGMLAAFCLPVFILITGILLPLGIIEPEWFNYQVLLSLLDFWLVKLIIITIISLPVWHGMHRIYHGLFDLGQRKGRSLTFYICYGFALIVTVLAALMLL